MFKGGLDGSSEGVVKNVQRRLGRVLRRGCRKRSMKAGMGSPYGLLENQKKAGTDHRRGSGGFRKNVQRKIGRVVKNVQRRLRRVIRRVIGIVQMKAGMGPPDGSLETSKNKGLNGSLSGDERVFGNFPLKRSMKAETSRNGSTTETFKEGALERVVRMGGRQKRSQTAGTGR